MPIPDGTVDIIKLKNGVVTTYKWIRDSWARKKIIALQQAVSSIVVPTRTSQLTNDSGYITQADVPPGSTASTTTPLMDGTAAVGTENAFARGDHRHPSDTNKADKATTLAGYGITNAYTKTEVDGMIPTVPTKTSDLTNDSGYITSAPVQSVNGQTGAVNLDATDVGALPDTTVIPTKTSDLTNDSGFLTSAPVTSVNGKTGAVSLSASDVGALPSSTAIPSATSDLTNDSGFITASSVPSASSTAPAMDGTASAGSATEWARGDHVHPHDTTKQDALSAAQLAAANSGITANDLAVNDASVLCTITPIVPTLNAGTHYATYGGCWYYKVGNRVRVHIGVDGITASTATVLWTMPVGYRPKDGIAFTGQGTGLGNVARCRVTGTGAVQVYSSQVRATAYCEYDAFA